MREYEEAFIVGIRSVSLDLNLVLLKKVPVVTILETGLHENAIQVRGKVLASDYLPNEVHLRFEVSLCAQLATKLLHLLDLLLLEVLQSLLLSLGHRVPTQSAPIIIIKAGRRS